MPGSRAAATARRFAQLGGLAVVARQGDCQVLLYPGNLPPLTLLSMLAHRARGRLPDRLLEGLSHFGQRNEREQALWKAVRRYRRVWQAGYSSRE